MGPSKLGPDREKHPMNPLKIGTFSTLAAIAMLAVELMYKPIFTVRFTSDFAIPIWALAGAYGLLQLLVWHWTRKGIKLSDKEVRRWGPALERATPEIMERISAGTSVKIIASELQDREGIPKDVTLRYIIAMGSYDEEATAE